MPDRSPSFTVSSEVKALPQSRDKAHHHGDGYINPWPSFDQRYRATLWSFMRARFFSSDWKEDPLPSAAAIKERLGPLPVELDWESPNLKDEARYTFLGHAAWLLELPDQTDGSRGLRILFDPALSRRCSPSQILGPARYTEPGLKIEQLPTIDLVVISHNHYDHLDYNTIRHLVRANAATHFFFPAGNESWADDIGIPIDRCTTLDWWESKSLTGGTSTLELTALPAQHFTGRTAVRNKSLWASWALKYVQGGRSISIYFTGDTGYRTKHKGPDNNLISSGHCPAFAAIGAHFGSFDLAFIPIGAYEPEFLMSQVHVTPEDATEIHKDIRSKQSVGMHFGTWRLSVEPIFEPIDRLEAACRDQSIPFGFEPGGFGVVKIGQTRTMIL